MEITQGLLCGHGWLWGVYILRASTLVAKFGIICCHFSKVAKEWEIMAKLPFLILAKNENGNGEMENTGADALM